MKSLATSVRYFLLFTSVWARDLAGHKASVMYHRDNHVVPLLSLMILNAACSEAVTQLMCREISN
jgi:hypothetical protein